MDRVIVVELAGAPGSGKTTLLPTVVRTCESAGLRAYTVEEAARTFARRTTLGRVAALLPSGLQRRALWALYYLSSAVAAVGFARSHPDLVRYVLRTQRARPAAADVADRRVVYWYFRTAGADRFLRAKGRPGEAVVVDEGFVHRALQLHASSVERPEPAQIAGYVDLVPPSELLVVVGAPAGRCRDRVRARGVWERLSHRRAEEIDRFVSNAHRAIELASEAVRRSGRPIIEVDNAGDLDVARGDLRRRLEDVLGSSRGPGDGNRRRPPLRIRRPTRMADGITARTRSPVIRTSVCEAVLEQYGLQVVGPPGNVALGARNQNVVVRTSAGRKVLRRHRETARAATVRYEHSVLRELERRRFPAVRVTTTRSGDTIANHGGHLFALFDFTEGTSLSSCLMSPASRLALLATAGRTLARMHRELAGFAPEGAHHLGGRTATGADVHDLGWHLEALAALSSRDVGPAGRCREHQLALSRKRPDIAGRLVALHEALSDASLPHSIIHGDYGIHNLLFRRDGSAVVHDFELARREWRLIDLVIVLSRMPTDGGVPRGARVRAFLDGYRRETDLPAVEWRHLPEVWEYYHLTGAVRSWRNYFSYGHEHRLATALARVSEAERVREGARAR